jgi:hypothetical protein
MQLGSRLDLEPFGRVDKTVNHSGLLMHMVFTEVDWLAAI